MLRSISRFGMRQRHACQVPSDCTQVQPPRHAFLWYHVHYMQVCLTSPFLLQDAMWAAESRLDAMCDALQALGGNPHRLAGLAASGALADGCRHFLRLGLSGRSEAQAMVSGPRQLQTCCNCCTPAAAALCCSGMPLAPVRTNACGTVWRPQCMRVCSADQRELPSSWHATAQCAVTKPSKPPPVEWNPSKLTCSPLSDFPCTAGSHLLQPACCVAG